jgi:TPR repeat/Tetratricopeptide repeat
MTKSIAFVLLLSSLASAQMTPALSGEIHGDGIELGRLWVRIDAPDSEHFTRKQAVQPDGSFHFDAVPPGDYTLTVLDERLDPIATVLVPVYSMSPPVTVNLPRTRRAQPPSGPVSIARLAHKPPKSAVRSLLRAQHYADRGQLDRAIEELKKSVAVDPEFALAHASLGTDYLRVQRYAESAAELRKAVALDPYTAGYCTNLAMALGALGRMDEAETYARRGVELEPSSAVAEFALGSLLAARPATRDAAVPHLQFAARQIPKAREMLLTITARSDR